MEYIDAQFEAYLQEELKIRRSLFSYHDSRVHACLYFIAPTGHSLKSLDLVTMKKLDSKVRPGRRPLAVRIPPGSHPLCREARVSREALCMSFGCSLFAGRFPAAVEVPRGAGGRSGDAPDPCPAPTRPPTGTLLPSARTWALSPRRAVGSRVPCCWRTGPGLLQKELYPP